MIHENGVQINIRSLTARSKPENEVKSYPLPLWDKFILGKL